MLYLITIILLFYYFFYGFIFIKNIKRSLILFERESGPIKILPQIILLMPVLREQKLIKSTLKYLSEINYDLNKIKIVIITTEREIVENEEEKKTTIEIVKELVPELNKKLGISLFHHLHFPGNKGVKSDQLNYALSVLQNKNPNLFQKKNVYIGIYDADSRSNKDLLKILAKKAEGDNFPIAYQQPMAYLENYYKLPFSLSGFIMKAFALFHSRYSLGYETSLFLNKNQKFGKMVYCLGHGLFIRADFLVKIGFFPSPIEDTRFGHICSFLGQKINFLPSLATTKVTDKISTLVKETSVWFVGQNYLLEDLKIAKRIKNISVFQWIVPLMHRLFRNFIWLSEGLFLIVGIILAFVIKSWFMSILLFSGIFFYIHLPSFYLIWNSKKITKLSGEFSQPIKPMAYIYNLFFLPIAVLLYSVGPQLGLVKLLKKYFTGEITLPKTER